MSENNCYKINFSQFFCGLGVLFVLRGGVRVSLWCKQYLFTQVKDFNKVYGEGWVFIAGGSQGIGKEFACQFARSNCNILLASRSEKKLAETKNEISALNSNVKVEYFTFEGNHSYSDNFSSHLKEKLAKYEIKVFLNCVGVNFIKEFSNLSEEEIQQTVNLNVNLPIALTKVVTEKMIQRKKSLVVGCSSDLVLYAPPYLQVYSGCKSFLDVFYKSLRKEIENIDMTCLRIGPVKTPSNSGESPGKLSTEEFCERAINQLGNYQLSHGHYKFALMSIFLNNWLVSKIYTQKTLRNEFKNKIY